MNDPRKEEGGSGDQGHGNCTCPFLVKGMIDGIDGGEVDSLLLGILCMLICTVLAFEWIIE